MTIKRERGLGGFQHYFTSFGVWREISALLSWFLFLVSGFGIGMAHPMAVLLCFFTAHMYSTSIFRVPWCDGGSCEAPAHSE